MDTSDIISAILAGITLLGILVALYIGITSMRKSRQLQKMQYESKLLEDLVNWVLEVRNCNLVGVIKEDLLLFERCTKDVRGMKIYQSMDCGKCEVAFLMVHDKGLYMKRIARILGKDLEDAVDALVQDVNVSFDTFRKYRVSFMGIVDNIDEFNALLKKYADETEERATLLAKSAFRVIDEIGKIQTLR